MRKIFLFMMVTVDGYFEGVDHDISWHNVDGEFESFANEQMGEVGTILFGHRTYDMMASFWPTPKGQVSPVTAKLMNELPKVTIAHKPFAAQWNNTTVVSENIIEEIKKLKEASGKDIAILGSNNLCVSLMEAGLVDEFRLMINPVALGKGSPLFTGLAARAKLKLTRTREFKNGNVLHYYSPATS